MPGSPWRAQAPAQLAVDTPGLVALGGDHIEAARFFRQQIPQGFVCGEPSAYRRVSEGQSSCRGSAPCVIQMTPFAEFNIGSAPGHVGGDGDGAGLAGERDDFGLARMVFGVEDVVRNALAVEQAADHLGGVDGGGTDEDRLLGARARS